MVTAELRQWLNERVCHIVGHRVKLTVGRFWIWAFSSGEDVWFREWQKCSHCGKIVHFK